MRSRALCPPAALAGVLCLLATGLRAQEAPPAPAGGDQPVTLQFKYKTGAAQRFRTEVKQDLNLTPQGGGGGGVGPIPISTKILIAHTEKVTETTANGATLNVRMDSMNLASSVMGAQFVMKMQGGKTTATVNGQPLPAGSPGIAGLQSLGQTATVHRSSLGAQEGGGAAAAATGTNVTFFQLPATPVKPGDSWDFSQRIRPSLPGGVGGPAGEVEAPEIEFKVTCTLKSLETKNGRQYALIDCTGAGSSTGAAGPVKSMTQSFTGTTRFDVARGAMASGHYNADLALTMAGGLPGAPAGGPQGMQIDGTMEITTMEAPAAPAAKKPAPKKPVKRKK